MAEMDPVEIAESDDRAAIANHDPVVTEDAHGPGNYRARRAKDSGRTSRAPAP
jgi:hypothetical protein